MPPSPEQVAALNAAKSDGAFLHRVLKIERDSQHAICPMCKKPNMTVGPDKDGGGVFLWCCGSGCGAGTVVDALMKVEGKDIKTAMAEINKAYGNGHSSPQHLAERKDYRNLPAPRDEIRYGRPHPDPVLNAEAAEDLVKKSHAYLMDNLDLSTHFKRGITKAIIERYRIGFIQNERILWNLDKKTSWFIPAAWVLPITNAQKEVKGIKLHFEIRPKGPDGKDVEGKSRWVPYGTEPKFDLEKQTKPHHAFYTLWPHPNTLEDPHLSQELSTDIGWWIQRIPDGETRERWDATLRWARLEIALVAEKAEEDLDGPECFAAVEKAFGTMREEIEEVVSRVTKHEPSEPAPEDNPEFVEWQDTIFVCPGELKALALLSMGYRAIAVTSGESWIPPPEMLSEFRGFHTCVFYDEDGRRLDKQGRVQCPGKRWAQQMALGLARQDAASVSLFSGGHDEKPPPKIIEEEM